MRVRVTLVAGIAALALPIVAVALPNPSTSVTKVDILEPYFSACTGETVALSGQLHIC